MPIIEDNKLIQLSMPDILLKLCVYTAVPVNPNSGLQHYCYRYFTSTSKPQTACFKKKREIRESTLADKEVQVKSQMILKSIVDSVLNTELLLFLWPSWQR